MMKKFVSISADQTRKIGQDFARKLQGGAVVALYGDLGSGKTIFSQGVAKGLGVKEHITSPSFVLLKLYQTAEPGLKLAHFDFYRSGRHEANPADLMDYLFQDKIISLIEWADRIERYLRGRRYIKVRFKYLTAKDRREILIDGQ